MASRTSSFLLFLLCGLLIFFVPNLMPGSILSGNAKTLYLISTSVGFLLLSVRLRESKYTIHYFQVFFAFFVASFVYAIISPFGGGVGVEGKTFNVIISSILIVVSVLILNKVAGNDLASLYVKRGNLRLGLIIGLVTFFFFLATSVPASILVFGGQSVTLEQLGGWAPWLALFIFANAVREELLWRGLFLKKYEPFVGVDPANLLQAIVFGFAHYSIGANWLAALPLVGITLLLGLGFGAAMQKTDSMIASVLFHVGSDIPFMIAVFSFL